MYSAKKPSLPATARMVYLEKRRKSVLENPHTPTFILVADRPIYVPVYIQNVPYISAHIPTYTHLCTDLHLHRHMHTNTHLHPT